MNKFLFTLILFFSTPIFCMEQESKKNTEKIDVPECFPEKFFLSPRLHIQYLYATLALAKDLKKIPPTTYNALSTRLSNLKSTTKKASKVRKIKNESECIAFLAKMRRDLWMNPYTANETYTEAAIQLLPKEDQIASDDERFGVPHPAVYNKMYFPWRE